MPDQFNNSATVPTPTPAPEPLLQNKIPMPKGVLQKNLKMLVYLGAAGVLIAASILSSRGKQPVKAGTKGEPPQPFVQDTTDNNVQALRSQVEAERAKQQQDAALAAAMGTGANRINPVTGAPVSAGHVSRSGHTTGAGKLWHELKPRHAAAYSRATRGNADRQQGSRAGAQLPFLFEHRLQPITTAIGTAATPTRRSTSTTGTTWAISKRSPKHSKRSAPEAQQLC